MVIIGCTQIPVQAALDNLNNPQKKHRLIISNN